MKNNKREQLPRDVDALIAMIGERDVALAQLDITVEKQTERISALEHNLTVFARMLFGKSSEKRKKR